MHRFHFARCEYEFKSERGRKRRGKHKVVWLYNKQIHSYTSSPCALVHALSLCLSVALSFRSIVVIVPGNLMSLRNVCNRPHHFWSIYASLLAEDSVVCRFIYGKHALKAFESAHSLSLSLSDSRAVSWGTTNRRLLY